MNNNLVSLDILYKIIKMKGLNKYINSYGYSKKKDKKYYIILKNGKGEALASGTSGNVIHFGSLKYEDYLIHKDKDRLNRFRSRFKSLYETNKNNLNSPIFWSWNILW
jgi:hypothetical protein